MVVFLSPASIHTQLFCWLLFQSCFTYFQARLRITRWQTATTIGTSELHRNVSYLWAIPLCLLAANFGMHAFPDQGPVLKMVFFCAFFLGHAGLHAAFVLFAVPRAVKGNNLPTKTYQEALASTRGATYLNTNPIEVLKSQLSKAELPARGHKTKIPLVLYEVGREDLQPGAERKYYDIAKTEWTPTWIIDEIRATIAEWWCALHRAASCPAVSTELDSPRSNLSK